MDNNFFQKIMDVITPASTQTYTRQTPQPVATIRGVPVFPNDIQELKKIVFSEISNRPKEKKDLETRILFNTALNRVIENQKNGKNLSLTDILTQPNQYQGFNSPLYQLYGSTTTPFLTKTRQKEVDDIVNNLVGEATSTGFQDNTNGAFYYKHKGDSIYYDNKTPLFKKSQPLLLTK